MERAANEVVVICVPREKYFKEEWSTVPDAAKRLRWQKKTRFANIPLVDDLARVILEGKEEVFLGDLFASTSYLALWVPRLEFQLLSGHCASVPQVLEMLMYSEFNASSSYKACLLLLGSLSPVIEHLSLSGSGQKPKVFPKPIPSCYFPSTSSTSSLCLLCHHSPSLTLFPLLSLLPLP